MCFGIQLLLLLPAFILTTTTNVTFNSDNNDVNVHKSTSSYSAPPPHPPTSPFDTVPEMNPIAELRLAATCLKVARMHAWYLREGGESSEGKSKQLQEKDGDTSNNHHPYDVCFCADFLKHFSEDRGRDWIPQSYWAVIDEYCDSISNQTNTTVLSAPLAELIPEPHTTKFLLKRMVKMGYVIIKIVVLGSLLEPEARPAVEARRNAVDAGRPAGAPRRPAVARRRPAVTARRPAVAARLTADDARMAAVAAALRQVYIETQTMPTTPPNAPLRCICTKSLSEGCPCEEMTLEAQEAWRNSTPTNAPLRCICTKHLSEGCPCLEMALEAQEAWRN